MDKITPDPPVTPSMDNAFTRDLLKDRAALYRALDYYLPDANPSAPDEQRFYNVSKEVSFEDSMLYTADLLPVPQSPLTNAGITSKAPNAPWSLPCGICSRSPRPWLTNLLSIWGHAVNPRQPEICGDRSAAFASKLAPTDVRDHLWSELARDRVRSARRFFGIYELGV